MRQDKDSRAWRGGRTTRARRHRRRGRRRPRDTRWSSPLACRRAGCSDLSRTPSERAVPIEMRDRSKSGLRSVRESTDAMIELNGWPHMSRVEEIFFISCTFNICLVILIEVDDM